LIKPFRPEIYGQNLKRANCQFVNTLHYFFLEPLKPRIVSITVLSYW
jgi:hypothetical protein